MTLDTILTLLGAVLIVFGLYLIMANRGKVRAQGSSNKVEAFGIKIDVSNPSVLLVLLGVGLVLVPRFAPTPEPAPLELAAPQNAPGVPAVPVPVVNGSPPVRETPETAALPELPDEPTGAGVPKKPEASVMPPVPAIPDVAAAPQARKPAPPSAPKPKPAPVPELKPRVWVLVDAEVAERAGITGLTRAEYSAQLRSRLVGVAVELFGTAAVTHAGEQSVAQQNVAAICAVSPAPKVLLAALKIPEDDFSPVESSFWPLMQLKAINCSDGRVQASGVKRLTPKRTDKVFYEQDFVAVAQQFVATRSYFLQ